MKFVNPYNFISLPNEGVKKDIKKYTEKKELYTGKLSCHLHTKTPIILPDHSQKGKKKGRDKDGKQVDYDCYPFMTINGEPMIPGSSIRGVIRSTFEALTDSCLFTNDDYYFSSRTGVAKKPGLLKKVDGGWCLYEAVRYADKDNLTKKKNTGDIVKFRGGADKRGKEIVFSIGESSDEQTGYVLKMNRFNNGGKKSSYSVFEKVEGKDSIWTQNEEEDCIQAFHEEEDCIQAFYENIRKYMKNEENNNVKPARAYKRKMDALKSEEMIPVWYQESGKKYYLALSQLSRNVYTKKPKDIMPESLRRCESKSHVCPACALFGFVAEKNKTKDAGNSLENDVVSASHIRFSDAMYNDKNKDALAKDEKLLPILSSPRSSSLEFYLRHEEDFYHADSDGVTLSGRKFYWHHNDFKLENLKKDNNPKMASYMQYAREGITFDFDVYFDDITGEQLEQLYTALTFGENMEDGILCHKIGHGKPIGFGSVKITVDEVAVRSFSVKNSEKPYDVDTDWLSAIIPVDIPDEVKIAVNFESIRNVTIDYPRNNGEIYNWFSENRPFTKNNKAEYLSKLPRIIDKNNNLSDVTLNENPGTGKCKDNKKNNNKAKKPKNSEDRIRTQLGEIISKDKKTEMKHTASKKPKKPPKENEIENAIEKAKNNNKTDYYKRILEKLIEYTDEHKNTKYDKYVAKAKAVLENW